ncbi:hypothetical protein AB0H83_25305 [Dactylosporangium sp. NPDC050688]|uniref:hypothetical protein n=1 Tax=Dactylosporangium sp. NPDC050688 TaxID=3157217 RepID=UPI0034067306
MDLRQSPAVRPGSDAPALPGVGVIVETLLIGMHGGRLTYRVAERMLGDEEHPDAAALRLTGFDDGTVAGRVLHSTSWRFANGRIVLTYAALPDPDPGTALVFTAPEVLAAGGGPLSPAPAQIGAADVVAHACRHLALLSRTDPVIAAAAVSYPQLWALLDAHRPDVAGLLHQPELLHVSPH